MNLRSLRVFVFVMEEATLTRAAARLNMSESAASRLLQLLEQELRAALFRRDRKRLDPTDAAEALLPEAARILAQIDGLPKLLESERTGPTRPLRVVCHARVLNGLVLPALARLARARPEIAVRLDVQPRRDLGRRMMQGLFDIGVSALPSPTADLAHLVLGAAPLGVLLPSGHPLAGCATVATSALSAVPYIALDETTVIRRMVNAALSGAGQTLRVAHEVSTGAAAYRLVRDGLGFAFADAVALDPELKSTTVLVPWEHAVSVSYGVFRSAVSRQGGLPELERMLQEAFDARLFS
jgi:DNA-binding transcriptional LysR family regulator